MDATDLSSPGLRRCSAACGAVIAGIGAVALAGWALGLPVLKGLRPSYIPMAPNTALAFLVLGAGLLAIARGRPLSRGIAGLGAALIALVGLLRLSEYATGVELDVDRWIFHVRSGRFGLAPLGKMSLPTAFAFVAGAAALAALAWPALVRVPRDLTGACGLVAGVTGLIFSLGYLFSPDAPLLYGTHSIPMALNTALCFVVLGAGLAAAAGEAAFPLSRLCGPSIRARLLRVFLPLVVATVGIVAWLTHVISVSAGATWAALSSAALAGLVIVFCGLICEQIAGHVGERLERAEAELKRAHDELEVKVEQRTCELSHANADLSRTLRDLHNAHESLQRAHRELMQAQSRMIQQAKMASLGQTAAGVAHEINNPLAFVTNNLVVLRREVTSLHDILCLYQKAEKTLAAYERDLYTRISDLSEEVDLPFVLGNLAGLVERSSGGLQRIQKIVQALRDFAHLDEADFKEADLNAGAVTTVSLMRPLAEGRGITIETKLGPIPRLSCSPAKINLVLQSLITNAIDACSTGGQIVVTTGAANGEIAIEVSDNGSGIDPLIRDKVFDPFFTTKPVGKGTGLGLSISYGIVKDHGGTIDFDSIPGQHTRFTVRLPLVPPGEGFPHPFGLGGAREVAAPV